jgi:carbamoyltransferase
LPLIGPQHSNAEIESSLESFASRICWRRLGSLTIACELAARLIADGHVIAWHRGRLEFGPRALGNRSILADPGIPDMRDRINTMVKKRESFRPFAPACTLEEAPRWFEVAPGDEYPYMISVVMVREWARTLLPAVTHIDGSARLQTVKECDSPDFHALLVAVGKTTGRQMLLNTSFNVKGQPIVNTPTEAVETFLTTGIEFLFIDNYHVSRAND